jgi:hypothetical protein
MNNGIGWTKLGRLLVPNPALEWLATWAGASCVLPIGGAHFRVYITGKDTQNRSRIGTALLDVATRTLSSLGTEPILDLGERGSFDENGTSYPFAMRCGNRVHLYYLGWIRGVHVPWYNGLGLATSDDGVRFTKTSRAPIFDRDDDDHLGVGSMCVLAEDARLKMWYSRFERWGQGERDHKHYYNIKYAESLDGRVWVRDKAVCIDFVDPTTEFAIAKPSVLKLNGKYFMWYSHRGPSYAIGFAVSDDGRRWRRHDELAGITYSASGWDSEMQCYAHVFEAGDTLYMLYNGNGYGATGLGLASMSKDTFAAMTTLL